MDINEKVEQLMKITSALKTEITQLKGNDINTRLDELEQEKDALKHDILDLRHILTQQNEKILSLIKEQNDKLIETIEADKRAPKLAFSSTSEYFKLFPIKSLNELDELENIINDDNVDELRAIVRQLIQPEGIVKNISLVMAVPCIMECNVDGHHNKRRLMSSPKFMELIFRAAYDGGCRKTFLDEFRRGFKMVKNRHHKNLCLRRQMQRQKEEQAENRESKMEVVEMLPDNCIKLEDTEKIYFD